MGKLAVVVFNLGGPDSPAAVRPFLFNLFNDPAIVGAPTPIRWLLAQLISRRRAPVAREIYRHLGGGSPLLANTEAQAAALQDALRARRPEGETRVFVAMRYWHPFAAETAAAVKAFAPDEIVLLPLYPQFSTTTSGSSFKDWRRAAAAVGLAAPTRSLCCYPTLAGFVAAVAARIRPRIAAAQARGRPRVLFSAHGLPKKVVAGGDPYQWQVEQSAAAVAAALGDSDLDWQVCYQSRVGPLEWIGPSTEAEIARAGRDGVPVVLVPIAFVSEHSETLVELDIEYRDLAEAKGVPAYLRVPTVDCEAAFVEGLAALVDETLKRPQGCLCSHEGRRICPAEWRRCAFAAA